LLQAAGGYGAALVAVFVLAGIGQNGAVGDAGGVLLLVAWLAGMIHAGVVSKSVSSQLALLDTPTLKQAQHELDRRQYGRQLLKMNPSLARQLGVGRPDLAGSDNFGLIDVNHASVPGLTMLPGLTEEQARRIVEYRSQGGSFVSAEDLAIYLDLPPTTIGPLRDMAVFDMGTG
jgi:DNA uptake protein ComE-like DNA-binding protein